MATKLLNTDNSILIDILLKQTGNKVFGKPRSP